MSNNIFLLILIILVAGIFLWLYIENNRDIIVPSTGTFFLFGISMFVAFLGNLSWKHEFLLTTTVILILGFTAIVVSDRMGKILFYHSCSDRKEQLAADGGETLKRIDIDGVKTAIVIGLSLILTVAYIFDAEGSFILRQGIKFTMAAAYVNSFILVNNIISGKRKRKDLIYGIPLVCSAICSVHTGVRTEIYRGLLCLFIYSCILIQEKRGWKPRRIINSLAWKKIFFGLLLFLVFFFLLRNYIKTEDIGENRHYDFFMYLAFYVGSPWIVLNKKIGRGIALYRGTLWGNVTFLNLWGDLRDIGLVTWERVRTSFVSVDAHLQINANADTIFGPPLIDFGPWGMFVIIGLTYLFLTGWYYKHIKYSVSGVKRNYRVIIYAFIYYIVGISFYSSGLTYIVSFYYILTVVLIWMIYGFYFRIKLV